MYEGDGLAADATDGERRVLRGRVLVVQDGFPPGREVAAALLRCGAERGVVVVEVEGVLVEIEADHVVTFRNQDVPDHGTLDRRLLCKADFRDEDKVFYRRLEHRRPGGGYRRPKRR